MTTSWSHTVRGQLLSAAKSNVGGVSLAVLAMMSGPWLLASGLRGTWVWWNPKGWVGVCVGGFIVVATLVDWVLRWWWVG